MRAHKVGWHLQNMAGISQAAREIMESYAPPVAVTFLTSERVGTDQVKEILRISPNCHFFLRPFFDAYAKTPTQYIEDAKYIIDPSDPMVQAIPEGQRHLQIFNEQNMPHTTEIGHPADQWEGFGSTLDEMKRFNSAFCNGYDALKAINPTFRIGWPPLTPGNRDAYFRTDPEDVPYYMHGPEAAHENPTAEEIQAAIRSGPCYEALKRADEYLTHIYVQNDAEHQMYEIWAGLRFVRFAKFFPKPMDIWITELGIGSPVQNWTKWYELLRSCPAVKGTCIWMLNTGTWSHVSAEVKELQKVTGGEAPENPVTGPVPPAPEPKPVPKLPKRCFVGVCGRNDHRFDEKDFELLKRANIEAVKMMSHTDVGVFRRILEQRPGTLIITRLYMSGAFGKGRHPTPEHFVNTMEPVIRNLLPYCTHFEVHNEPNHPSKIEGWGQEDAHAHNFNTWFMETYNLLREKFPYDIGVRFGFPGLAVPHNDLRWLELCNDAIEMADWLGVHCYWQNPNPGDKNHLSPDWGMRFIHYHEAFPGQELHITEWGNSNCQSDLDHNWMVIAKEYVEYFQELFKYDIVSSASAFIMSSQDPAWGPFAWRSENGIFRNVVDMVGQMDRPTPAQEPASLAEIDDFIRNKAWNATGIAYNPNAAFFKVARAMGLGRPVTNELEMEFKGVVYVAQAYNKAILWCIKGQWDGITAASWL